MKKAALALICALVLAQIPPIPGAAAPRSTPKRSRANPSSAAIANHLQIGIMSSLKSATKPSIGRRAATKDEREEERVARDFVRCVYRVDCERIWFKLIPAKQRGACAAMNAVDTTSEPPAFDANAYSGLKRNKSERKDSFWGLKSAMEDVISPSGEVDRVSIANSDDNTAGVAVISFTDSEEIFPLPLVKDGNKWKVDWATWWIIGDPVTRLQTAYAAALDMKSAGDTDGARELLGDLMVLEDSFDRATDKPYTDLLKPEAISEIESEKPVFDQIRKDYEDVKEKPSARVR